MQQSPYSVYIYKRPIKIAFLISSTLTSGEALTDLIRYNQSRWGGRYNLIIQTDGHGLASESDWKLLEYLDPDVVKCFVNLDDDLIKELDARLSPYSLEVLPTHDNGRSRPDIHDEGLSLLPTLLNVRRTASASLPTLVLFNVDGCSDLLLKDFIVRNVGVLEHTFHIDRALEQVKTVSFSITDRNSFAEALGELTAFKIFVYPAQLCGLPKHLREHPRSYGNGERLSVVVGDTLADVVYYWNRIHLVPQWAWTNVKQIWLPSGLATDQSLQQPIGKWITRLADPGGSFSGDVLFVSCSLTRENLETVTAGVRAPIRVRHGVGPREDLGLERDIHERFLARTTDSDLYKGLSQSEHFVLTEPDVEEGVMGGQHWMVDVFIGFQHPTHEPRGNWWRFPKNNRIAHAMFQKSSRVALNGVPCVLMRREEPNLNLNLLPEHDIFYYVLAHSPAGEPRSSLSREKFNNVKPSDKGAYLSGVIDVFGSLGAAHSILESRYWRRMFDLLSRNAFSHDERFTVVRNKLKKKVSLNPSLFLGTDAGMDWLANYVIQLSKEYAGGGKEVPYRRFYEEALREIADFNVGHPNKTIEIDETELKDSITDLIEANILHLGIKPKCQKCGFKDWSHISEAGQTLKCKGCGSIFPIMAEEPWFYRLNTLVQAASALHGLTPVILVLGQLSRFTQCFFMSPSLDLFENEGGEAYSDLDIVCVADGRLIIGEIKQTNGLFDNDCFEKMTEISRRIRPDRVLFSSMEREPTRFIEGKLQRMKEVLAPLRVNVEWYRLEQHVFSPTDYF